MTITEYKPMPGDYAPFYRGYIEAVETDDITSYLAIQKEQVLDFLRGIKWENWEVGYAPDKWTLAEVVLHMIDAERVFAYRALCIARGDQTPLPGMEQDDYVPNSGAASRTPASIVDEFAAVREATLHLFKNFTDDMWERRGIASDAEVTVPALAYIIGGHTAHHLQVIGERYL
ncbi:MAG: DinB family protein [Bacteroidetes bacterium]|nr:MAG: DinB family protein [Bacteroidota bacterium]